MSTTRQIAAAFLLGALVGGATIQARDRLWLHRLVEERRTAREEARRLDEEARRLRQQLSGATRLSGRTLVEDVSVATLNANLNLADVEAALLPVTSALIGLPVKEVAPELIYRLFNDRIIAVRGHLYRVEVLVIVVTQVVRILVRLTPAHPAPGSGV